MIDPLISVDEIRDRLNKIFPEGIPDRQYFVRDLAARTIFVFLYTNAIEGQDIWLAPKHVIRMSDKQAHKLGALERLQYYKNCRTPGYETVGTPWYKENTREPIRDETINGLINLGVVIVKPNVPTTSSKGRYCLTTDFSALFEASSFSKDIQEWQEKYFSASHLASIKVLRRMSSMDDVIIELPDKTTRKMEPGPSSVLTKEVIEKFIPTHLRNAGVLWISSSGNKVIQEDDELMKSIGLPIDQKTLLPDIVLVDQRNTLLLIFVEVIASDGPITEQRKKAILELCTNAGFSKNQVLLINAFKERNDTSLKKRFSALATDSLVWCASEPELLIWIGKDQEQPFKI
ncbi:MAG: BsuBI/PstI family type II restriction endonuclease [Bacteroidota bacterium]